jgi:hypothetical protein
MLIGMSLVGLWTTFTLSMFLTLPLFFSPAGQVREDRDASDTPTDDAYFLFETRPDGDADEASSEDSGTDADEDERSLRDDQAGSGGDVGRKPSAPHGRWGTQGLG